MPDNIMKHKSFAFAVRIVKLNAYLHKKQEFVVAKQLLRSGTAVGALIREAEYAESKADFKHKLAIARKEGNETLYWLELLYATQFLTNAEYQSIYSDADELMRLLTSSIKTAAK